MIRNIFIPGFFVLMSFVFYSCEEFEQYIEDGDMESSEDLSGENGDDENDSAIIVDGYCDKESDCEDWDQVDFTCINHKCVTKPCETDEDCGGYFDCISGYCQIIEYWCGYDNECPSDMYCTDYGMCTHCRCEKNSDCPSDYKCNGCKCVECTEDFHCANYEYCRDYECVNSCSCASDEDCPDAYICEDCACIPCDCRDDDDCPLNYDCDGCYCQQTHCYSYGDCPDGYICGYDNICIEEPECNKEFIIDIVPKNIFITEGEEIQIEAVLLDKDKYKIMFPANTNNFDWELEDSATASINRSWDSNTATITGTNVPGAVTLTVSISLWEDPCSFTNTFTFTNYSKPADNDSQVLVYDNTTGKPLENIPVFLIPETNLKSKNEPAPVFTDEKGIANFSGFNCQNTACELHIFSSEYNYISAFDLKTNNILVPLQPNQDLTKAGGVKGHMDRSLIPKDLRCDTFLGYTAFAQPGNLTDLSFSSLFSEKMNNHFKIGATIDEWYPIPVGLEGYLNPEEDEITTVMYGYYASGNPYTNTLWSFGGYTCLADILSIIGPALGGEEIKIAPILVAIVPILQNFYYGAIPYVDYTFRNKIKDELDFNGDGQTDDLIPDYSKYSELTTVVSQSQNQTATVVPSHIPQCSSCLYDFAFYIMGIMKEDGFVPLGFNATMDEDENGISNCFMDAFEMSFAPQSGGIQGYPYTLIEVMIDKDILFADDDLDIDKKAASISIVTSATIPSKIIMPDTVIPMTDNMFDQQNHSLTADNVDNADFHRAIFSVSDETSKRFWHIYWNNGNGFNITPSILSTIEDRTANYKKDSTVQTIKLKNDLNYDSLFKFNSTNIGNINPHISAFSNTPMKEHIAKH